MDRTTIVGCAVGVAVAVGAIVGLGLWNNRDRWQEEVAEATIIELTDLYNDAIREHPGDRSKAIFAFDLAVAKKRAEFLNANEQYEEHAEWLKRFDAQAIHLRKALRKG